MYVEYWSRTLTAGSQLCKECKGSALGRTFYGPRRQPVFENAPLQIGSDQLESPLIRDPLGQAAHQPVMADAVERAHLFIPLSTTHVL